LADFPIKEKFKDYEVKLSKNKSKSKISSERFRDSKLRSKSPRRGKEQKPPSELLRSNANSRILLSKTMKSKDKKH
jgi:hypothetical protein